jgi:chromate transporter
VSPWLYLLLLLRASLFSTGGSGNIPMIYDDFVGRGWATDDDIAQAFAIGQISPGPTGLWVVSFGYLTDGIRGALLAVVAISIPPLFVIVLDGIYRRVAEHPVIEGFIRGLSLGVVGIFVVVLARLMYAQGIDVRALALAALAFAAGATGRFPPIVVLLLAAVLGIVLY